MIFSNKSLYERMGRTEKRLRTIPGIIDSDSPLTHRLLQNLGHKQNEILSERFFPYIEQYEEGLLSAKQFLDKLIVEADKP
jgi:hypothetical protein